MNRSMKLQVLTVPIQTNWSKHVLSALPDASVHDLRFCRIATANPERIGIYATTCKALYSSTSAKSLGWITASICTNSKFKG